MRASRSPTKLELAALASGQDCRLKASMGVEGQNANVFSCPASGSHIAIHETPENPAGHAYDYGNGQK
jgi:hypothetical protein